ERTGGDLQGDRAVAHGDAMAHADELGDTLLELLRDGTVVRQPAALENLGSAAKEAMLVADVRATDVHRLVEHGRRTVDREVARRCDGLQRTRLVSVAGFGSGRGAQRGSTCCCHECSRWTPYPARRGACSLQSPHPQ